MFDALLKPENKIVNHAAPSMFYNEDRAASYPFYSSYPVRMIHVARTGFAGSSLINIIQPLSTL